MKRVIFGLIGLATLGLAVGYGLSTLWGGMSIILLTGALWLTGERRALSWPASLGLALFTTLAAYGTLQRIPLIWLLPSTLMAFIAWDLTYFQGQLQGPADVRHETYLRWLHGLRLGAITGAGLILSWLALSIEISLNPIWAILLGLLAVISLSRAIRLLRRESD